MSGHVIIKGCLTEMIKPTGKVILTGLPGCGKTTAVMRILENLEDINTAGFYTKEIHHKGRRLGTSGLAKHNPIIEPINEVARNGNIGSKSPARRTTKNVLAEGLTNCVNS